MKQATVHLIVAFFVIGLVRADQTTQSVQQALKDQGFYYGNVTGDKSAETTAALRRYQIRNGLQVTGELSPETLNSLNLRGKTNSVSSSQPTSKPAVTQSNNAPRNQSGPVGWNPPPQTPTQPDQRLQTNPAFAAAPYQTMPLRISDRIVIAQVQRQLMAYGYYRGRVDGKIGPRTAFGLRAFQFRSGLPPTGRLETQTLSALGLSDANLAYLQPAPRSNQAWVPVTKFKHGKWKVKWKKIPREDFDEYGDENRQENAAAWWNGEDRED